MIHSFSRLINYHSYSLQLQTSGDASGDALQLYDHTCLKHNFNAVAESKLQHTQQFRYRSISKHIPIMKVPLFSTLVASVALATPATAGLLSCLSTILPYGLGDFTKYTPLLDQIPTAVTGLKIILTFPTCAVRNSFYIHNYGSQSITNRMNSPSPNSVAVSSVSHVTAEWSTMVVGVRIRCIYLVSQIV